MPLKNQNSKHEYAIFVFVVLFVFLQYPPHLTHASSLSRQKTDCDNQKVLRVIDGDTFEIPGDKRVRLLGVDTPETVRASTDIQWFGREASRKLRDWIEGRTVCLRQGIDKTQDVDKYNRLLRYVWRPDGFFVNAELIKQGYGFAYTRYPFEYMDEFREYERKARDNDRGLWDREKQMIWEREIQRNEAIAGNCGKAGTICPGNASQHIGSHKTVRFFVRRSHDSGNTVYLNSKNDYKDHDNFAAVIFAADKGNFPPRPSDVYWGKTVDVTGIITQYKGRTEMILKDKVQIKIISP
ncbi:MAG: thermonuclease family protein [Nitrospirae bacterium]|nr:thermonuclease family protein [Nitrospirota bacterium]